ncbi:MAG: restriction endonuclease subunit S [Opitutaceae bacterium]
MQLTKGYKQTEVGVIPEDWEEPKLGSVCKLINGRGFKPYEWKDAGLPIIRIQNLNGSDDFNYFDGHYAKKLEIKPKQLLFAWSGSRGTSFGPHIWNGPLGLLNYHTWKVQVNQQVIDEEFFLYALRQLTKFIEDQAHGAAALVHVQKWEMETFKFPLPPTKAEQEAIAGALSDADAWIESLEQLIAKKRRIKEGASQALLTGNQRLPGFTGDWEVKTLGEIGTFKNGLNKDSTAFGHGSPFVNLMDVFGVNAISESTHLGLVASTKPDREIYNLRRGDVMFIRSSVKPSGVGLTAVIQNDLIDTVYSGFLIRFRDNESMDLNYKRYCFYEESFRKEIIAASSSSANTNINQNNLRLMSIQLPPTKAEQTAIAEILSEMDAELDALAGKLSKARQIKQGMMQELLTGKTRLV